jgi:hypothetical protein
MGKCQEGLHAEVDDILREHEYFLDIIYINQSPENSVKSQKLELIMTLFELAPVHD